MTTYAARQHDIWQAVVISLQAQLAVQRLQAQLAVPRMQRSSPGAGHLNCLAAQAEVILGAIHDYYPYDYQYGADWPGNETAWRAAPQGFAQAKALAALARIKAELVKWQTLHTGKA